MKSGKSKKLTPDDERALTGLLVQRMKFFLIGLQDSLVSEQAMLKAADRFKDKCLRYDDDHARFVDVSSSEIMKNFNIVNNILKKDMDSITKWRKALADIKNMDFSHGEWRIGFMNLLSQKRRYGFPARLFKEAWDLVIIDRIMNS